MSRSTIVITGLLTVIAVLLGVLVTVLLVGPREQVQAAPAAGRGDIVVVSGEYERKPVIWVVDTALRSMVAYKLNRGNEIFPVSMRAIGPDLEYAPALLTDEKNRMGGQVGKIRAGQREYVPRKLKKALEKLNRSN